MNIKQLLDDELKKRNEDDILAGHRFAPSLYGLPPTPSTSNGNNYGNMPAAQYGKPPVGKSSAQSATPAYLAVPNMQQQQMNPAYALQQPGTSVQPGISSEQMNVSYTSQDGTHIQMSATYNSNNKAQAVGNLMQAAYGMVMTGGNYHGAKGLNGSNGSKGSKGSKYFAGPKGSSSYQGIGSSGSAKGGGKN